MGIRFRCTHCDRKLNVKAKQAGDICVCPDCENEIQVPLESELPKRKRNRRRRPSLDTLHEPLKHNPARRPAHCSGEIRVDAISKDDGAIKNAESKAPFGDCSEATKVRNAKEADDAETDDPFVLTKPVIKIEDDPLQTDPNRIWYVRHPELGEKGPLKSAAIKAMIEEGYLRVGHIVWREDWNDWLKAEEVFSKIAAQKHQALTDPDWAVANEENSNSRANKNDANEKLVWVTIICVSFLTAIVLFYLYARFLA